MKASGEAVVVHSTLVVFPSASLDIPSMFSASPAMVSDSCLNAVGNVPTTDRAVFCVRHKASRVRWNLAGASGAPQMYTEYLVPLWASAARHRHVQE